MSPEPTTPDEEPKDTDLVTYEALEQRFVLFERGFKNRLEPTIKEAAQKIADSAIRALKSDLERAQLEQSNAQSEAKWKRTMEWQNRVLSAGVGFVICLLFGAALTQCNELHNRITNLELKK